MARTFAEKLTFIQHTKHNQLGLLLAPRMDKLPLSIRQYDEPFLPFGKSVISGTNDLICAYIFDFASYLIPGAAGIIALERTIKYAGIDAITILHGPFSTPAYAQLLDETSFGLDAVTLADNQFIDAYIKRPDRKAFVIQKGEPQLDDAPGNFGFYWDDSSLMTILGEDGQTLTIRLLNLDSLDISYGEDFFTQLHSAVEAQRV